MAYLKNYYFFNTLLNYNIFEKLNKYTLCLKYFY